MSPISHYFSSPKASACFFLPFFRGLLPTATHLPFAVALFAVGGRGREGKKRGKDEIVDHHLNLADYIFKYSQFLSMLDSVQQDGNLQEMCNGWSKQGSGIQCHIKDGFEIQYLETINLPV